MVSKTALITGASRGLGLALARELAAHGWTLILDARGAQALNAVHAELSSLTTVTPIVGDVTDSQHRVALMQAIQQAGGLDVLVNNASTLGISPRPNLLDYPLDALTAIFQTNVIAPLALMQAASPYLKDGAKILNISSDAAVEPYAGWGGYGASKAALEHMTAIFAAENPRLRVYWVDPGDMQTQMHQEAFPNEDISDRPLPETSIPGLVALIAGNLPSGRYQARKIGLPENGVRELRTVLRAKNADETLAFYRDCVGLKLLQTWENDAGRGYLLEGGRATLEILDEGHAAFVDNIELGSDSGNPIRLGFEVANLDAAAGTITDNRLNHMVTTPWGDRNLRVQAPDNLQVTLFQVAEKKDE